MQRPTLRDRHRLRTLRELHEAALHLAREGGLAAATVEAITDRAGVSRRTFFNYYATKEDALLATTAPVVPSDALERFLAHPGGDAFAEAVRLVLAIVTAMRQVEVTLEDPARLVVEFPALGERLAQHVFAVEALIATALDERPAPGRRSPSGPDGDPALALVMLAGTVLRFAYLRDPGAATGPSLAAIESAMSVFRHLVQEVP